MKIFLIKIDKYPYDSYSGFVIVANNEEDVRNIAKEHAACEGKEIWEIAKITNEGEYSGEITEPFVLLDSFHAG